MSLVGKLEVETVETDVLVIGGGLAGCMAAIRAGEIVGPKNVLIAEKSNIRRSGNAATGVDHTWSFMPEVHGKMGYNMQQLVEDHIKALGSLQDADLIFTVASTIADRITEMESWGFPFKTGGQYDYVQKIHRVPTFLHWAGRDQKIIFAKELARRGIKVINRVMITELITEEQEVLGAIGIGIREPKFYVFQAKSVVVATADATRLFPSPTSIDFNRGGFTYGSGDGIAMGYRAGAELTNLEFVRMHAGPKNFCKSGRGTYIGVVEDASGKPIGEVRAMADPKKIDLSVESPEAMIKAYLEGRGPIYMNCTGTSESDRTYMEWGLMNEGNVVTLDQMNNFGIDVKTDRIEFTFYEPTIIGGLAIDAKGKTNLNGLYAAGDVVGNLKRGVSPGAFAIGWIAGASAARHSESKEFNAMTRASSFIESKMHLYNEILDRKEGATWQEMSLACQNVMNYYVGKVRYETLLQAGLAQLINIRQRALGLLKAENPHELMRCLEALNLTYVGEAMILCSLERKESRPSRRGTIKRVDFPEINETLNKLLILRLEKGKPIFQWREPRSIPNTK